MLKTKIKESNISYSIGTMNWLHKYALFFCISKQFLIPFKSINRMLSHSVDNHVVYTQMALLIFHSGNRWEKDFSFIYIVSL